MVLVAKLYLDKQLEMINMNSEHKFNVAIIGAGPAGIGVALGLTKRGIKSVVLIERNDDIGGVPSIYKKKKSGIPTFINWIRGRVIFGEDYAGWLHQKLSKTDVRIWRASKVLRIDPERKSITLVNSEKGPLDITANAVVLACGAREKSPVEFGWLSGARSGRIFFSKNLLELIDQHDILPLKKPVVIGSDLNAYAIAAKLKQSGAEKVAIIDNRQRPKSPLFSRLYFRLWKSKPKFHAHVESVTFKGNGAPSAVVLDNGTSIPCDGIVLSGDLIPNSELALLARLKMDIPSRKPMVNSNFQLSEPAIFAAGNILGGFHGAEWCYFNGLKVAKKVAEYVKNG
ncbi:FAD-dependent oxidoreductase [candidate division KSB1 bacterium]|nr:FAD-dependent oxidoreductase [candidate division KSB1 bacterium]